MTTQQEIERNVRFLEEVRALIKRRIKDPEAAYGEVCSLTLAAVQVSSCLHCGDRKRTRDMMVRAINLGLNHGV